MEMELQKVHLIRLEKDEELLTSILEYVKKKKRLIEYKGGTCERCGLKDESHPAIYDFHHTIGCLIENIKKVSKGL